MNSKRLRGATDKPISYLEWYERNLAAVSAGPFAVLELGVAHGGSLIMWRDYFAEGPVCGVDRDAADVDDQSGRVHVYVGDQADRDLLDSVSRTHAPAGWDLIVDDASHLGYKTKASFWHLFNNHLKPGAVYAIEDTGAGYWENAYYRDGRHADPNFASVPVGQGERFPSHLYGTIGFVKQLIDEVSMYDLTHPEFGVGPHRESRIARMEITPGLVLVWKR